jgi:hypothetical protein
MGTTTGPARPFDIQQAIALAQAITGSRQQFADAFRKAQTRAAAPLELEAFASGVADKVAACAQGFLRAAEGGWLVDLCIACLADRIVDEGFGAATAGVADDARLAALQQITDAARGMQNPGVVIDRLPRAMRQVCQVEIGGEPRGTGFLIRDDLVMTAYHVIRPLLDGADAPLPGSAARLRFRFDYARRVGLDGNVALVDGTVCRAADPWLEALSPCTPAELLNTLPPQEDELNNFWDFAVVRLAEVPGVARAGLEITTDGVALGHRLLILQHPRRGPLLFDQSTVQGFLGNGGFRIVHDVNTEEGSSGSPCLNDQFKVVGLHQARMPASADARKKNRAVPMRRILGTLALGAVNSTSPRFRPLVTVATRDRARHPVFGRVTTQEWVWRATRRTAPAGAGHRDRFLVVSGAKGSGKRFTLALLQAMLPSSEHSLLECRASDFVNEKTALGFATKYLLAPLGADAGGLPGLDQADTSDNAWLNYQLVGDLLSVMDRSRKGRMVWVVLDELDAVVLPDQGQVRKLLDLLYARAELAPWLRFVLLGLEAVPVPAAAPFTDRDLAGPASAQALESDVVAYLMRRLEESAVSPDENLVRGTVGTIIPLCIEICEDRLDHERLMSLVVRKVLDFEQRYLAGLGRIA